MFDNILTCYDFSEPSRATLECALKIGWRFNSNLEIVHVLTHHDRPLGRNAEEQTLGFWQKLRGKIEDEVRLRSSVGKNVELKSLNVKLLEGHPVVALLKEIEKQSPDLVLIGTHGWSAIFQFMLGSVAEKIVRYSPSPVLTVRRSSGFPPQTLLVPTDFSETSEETLLLASQIGQITPIKVELLHVLWPLPTMAAIEGGYGFMPPVDQDILEKETKVQLDGLIAKHPSLKMTAHVTMGPAAQVICDRARKINADLILIPTHSRSNIGHLLMGSVAEQVVRYAPSSVLSFCPKKTIALRKQIVDEL